MSKGLSLTSTECAWLKPLIKADIYGWQEQAKHPFEEAGHQFTALMQLRIENMQSLLGKIESFEGAERKEAETAARKASRQQRQASSYRERICGNQLPVSQP